MAYFCTGLGRIELQIELEHANTGYHQGRCDADVEQLLTLDYIKVQLDAIPPALLADELREYGTWDQEELADHEQNKARLLWLACGDIAE